MHPTFAMHTDGTRYRDLNGNGRMDPYEDPRLPVAERVADLVGRLSLEEKAGLMMHSIVSVSVNGDLDGEPVQEGRPGPAQYVTERLITHLNVHRIPDPRSMARWANAVQALAETTPHGIPVTISTDPRHSVTENWGASFSAEHLSAWPEPIGLGALGDEDLVREFADIARREYLALGIRSALHPTLDVATEPRWARQYSTFGQSVENVARLGIAYVQGFEGPDGLGSHSVACMAKHFPGGGAQLEGEDPHFPYGKEQVYPGGRFEDHLEPFRRIAEHGVSAMMPSYGVPKGLVRNDEQIQEVGFGFNRQMLTGLLRGELGYDGVICADWALITESRIGEMQLPARAWGVEELDELGRVELALLAGCDQLGGEERPDWIVELVRAGRITEDRIDESVRRLLTVKFRLGLFDDPYVDEEAAVHIVGSGEFRAAGHRAQIMSVTPITDRPGVALVPLAEGTRVHSPSIADDAIVAAGLIPAPEAGDADVIVLRIDTPYDPRDRYLLESAFHAGSLEFSADQVGAVGDLAAHAPVIAVVHLERPALLGPIVQAADAVLGVYGSSDAAVLEALTRAGAARGVLPFDIPRDADALARAVSDVPGSTHDPLFRAGL